MNPHVPPPPHSPSRFWADWSTRDFAQANGIVLLPKPFSLSEVRDALARALAGAPGMKG